MNSKTKTIIAACIAGFTQFISWLFLMPVEQQQGVFSQVAALMPETWKTTFSGITHAIVALSGIYALYHAANSAPATPSPAVPAQPQQPK
jgi:hypothetical protein